MKKNNALTKVSCLLLLISLPFSVLQAQNDPDFMRSMGKMYVVVAVIAVIFIGVIFFLFYLERKLTKLERQIKDHD